MKVPGCIAMKNFLLVLLSLFCINAYAEINKWVDDQGRVHYSDQPPPSNAKRILRSAPKAKDSSETSDGSESENAPKSESENVTKSESENATESGEPKSIAEREAELRKKIRADKEAANKAAKEQAAKAANQENCNQVQQSLRELQSGMRIVELDANGERVYLDNEQRQQRIEKAKDDFSRLCN
jgi:hypothetical protein